MSTVNTSVSEVTSYSEGHTVEYQISVRRALSWPNVEPQMELPDDVRDALLMWLNPPLVEEALG